MSELKKFDLEGVLWREYDTGERVYRIENPVCFWHRPGGTTHRVMDKDGVVHIVPAPGPTCFLRYKKTEGVDPCQF